MDANNQDVRKPYDGLSRKILPATLIFVFLLLCVFHLSQVYGGETWDEHVHRLGLVSQLHVAHDWLAGKHHATFRRVHKDLAYYGVLPLLPAYLSDWISLRLNLSTASTDNAYRYVLHATAFASYLLALLLSARIYFLLRVSNIGSWAGVIALAVYPLWLGYASLTTRTSPQRRSF